MKKLFTLIVVALVSAAAFATDPGDGSKTNGIAVMRKSDNTFNLFYSSASLEDVKVHILNASGKQIYSETVRKTDGFVRPYTFTNLNPGDYTIKVVDGNDSYTEKFSYGNSTAKKIARVAKLKDGRYTVSIPSNLYQGVAEIKIYNDGTLAHKESITATSNYAQVFNVASLTGDITFDVIDSKGNKIN